jgi:hypothetical protein
MISAMSFLAELHRHESARVTARKPLVFLAVRPQTACVEIHDLAPVSMSVRSISDSVRQTTPPVSTNVRRKSTLILRRAVHDRAPVQLQPRHGRREEGFQRPDRPGIPEHEVLALFHRRPHPRPPRGIQPQPHRDRHVVVD